MTPWLFDKHRIKRASQYIIAAVLSVLILCFVLKIWRADFRDPFHYNGDALLHVMFIKGIIDNGWYLQNGFIGAPGGLKMYDFPAVDNAAAVILALISFFTKDPILILNLFYLLTFPLVALSSLYVFRQFNLSYGPALLGSLLYTFVPYHFMRDESHLFLSSYYSIPLVVMVLLWVMRDELTADDRGLNVRNRKFILSVVICVLVGSTGTYYPFFSCFLLLVAGISAALSSKKLKPLGIATILVVVTFAAVVINLSPSIVYLYKHGDAGVTARSLAGPEIYGLKIAQLLLPITGHRIDLFNRIKKTYNDNTVMTENDAASLGIIGSLGFLTLIGLLFCRRAGDNAMHRAMLDDLSVLNLFAVLLGTIGGFGSLFALFVSAAIRSYNRISIFIAFFSLFVVAVGLEWIYRRIVKSKGGSIIFNVLLVCLLVAGVFDQTSKAYVPQYGDIKAEFLSDRHFVRNIEASVPAGAMVLQLPYVAFPESPRIHRMVDYDHLRGYIHSSNLRWSYGTMKNREGDQWLREITALPVGEMVQALSFAGFSGVYIDRQGYDDNGSAIERQLNIALSVTPVVSRNGRFSFFNVTDYKLRLREEYSQSEWQTKEESSLHPLLIEWTRGFSELEASPEKTWRWCSSEGELHFNNTSRHARKVSLEMSFASGYPQYNDLIISGLISEHLKTNEEPSSYSKTITVPPGESVIKFTSNAKKVDAPLDPRVLVFRIENFKMKALE